MDIASDGAVLSTCNRFAALLKRGNISGFLGQNVFEVLSNLGKIDKAFSPDIFTHGLPDTIDLAVEAAGSRSFTIKWLPTPRYADAGAAGSPALRAPDEAGRNEGRSSGWPQTEGQTLAICGNPGNFSQSRIAALVDPGGWQFTGLKIYADPLPVTRPYLPTKRWRSRRD